MADENIVTDQNMTKSPANSDIGEDIYEKDNPDENEDEGEIDPNFVEERFRVDRRKLEQMIQGQVQMFCQKTVVLMILFTF